MTECLFVSDLHGARDRYDKLFRIILAEKPAAVFMGGDLLPGGGRAFEEAGFVSSYLERELARLRAAMAHAYPRIFVILGNDDPRSEEPGMERAAASGVWEYAHNGSFTLDRWRLYGYSYIPPTPFLSLIHI